MSQRAFIPSRTCEICGKGCVGQRCRPCYTDLMLKKGRKHRQSIWRREWSFIYELLDPDTGHVHYVGCSEHPKIRLNLHERNAWIEASKKDMWIRDLVRQKKHPILRIVKKVPYSQRFEEEQRHIRSLLDAGIDLLNMVVRQ